jgi:probable addiction module antidote protein
MGTTMKPSSKRKARKRSGSVNETAYLLRSPANAKRLPHCIKHTYQSDLLVELKNTKRALAYLRAALEETDVPEVFLVALRNVAEARGISKLAREAHMNREHLYRLLSKHGNPSLGSLSAILAALGIKLSLKHHAA